MNKGIIIGIIIIAIIIIGAVSYSSVNQNNDDLPSEVDVTAESLPKTGTNYSLELTESLKTVPFLPKPQPLTAATQCAVSELTAETSAPHSGVPKPIGRHLHRWAMMSHACGQRIVLVGISSRIRRR